MTKAEDVSRADQQEIDRLLERDRHWRDEVRTLHERLAAKGIVIDRQQEVIDTVHEAVRETATDIS